MRVAPSFGTLALPSRPDADSSPFCRAANRRFPQHTRRLQPPQASSISPSEWRHPLDASHTELLRSIPLLPDAVRTLVAPPAQHAMRVSHLGSALAVSETQLPWLWKLHAQACATLLGPAARVPSLYLRNAPGPNAYTLAFQQGVHPAVVLHTDTLDCLDGRELQAVLAHELAHIACEHGVWLTAARLLPGAPSDGARAALARWARAAELSGDRGALLVTRSPDVVVSALMKLMVGGTSKVSSQLNLAAFRAQAASVVHGNAAGVDVQGGNSLAAWIVDTAAAALMPYVSGAGQSEYDEHPSAVFRAAEIDKWAGSQQARALLKRLP